MKAVMYHYVRPAPDGLPEFRYLHVDDFVRQLDWFSRNHRFVRRDEFDALCQGEAGVPDGILLTFDDGLSDHYRHVKPILAERGLFGLFYVCTAPLEAGELLDVHRIHLLLGRLGGPEAMRRLSQCLTPGMLNEAHVGVFSESTYRHQNNDQATTIFKRTLNYWIGEEHRTSILDRLFSDVFGEEELDFYLTSDQLVEMEADGMVIGSHTVSHNVLGRLPVEDQRSEIFQSLACLGRILGKPATTFCYPFGGRHTYTDETVAILEAAGSRLSFAVEPRDVTAADLKGRHALPRYDCNMFAFGKASVGAQRALQAA